MEFFESPAFGRHYREYLDEDEYRLLQKTLAANPTMGEVMPGTGGFRKVRWADPKRGKGKRGGLRLIYYYFLSDQQIWLIAIYDKSEMADLSASEKQALRVAVERETTARRAIKANKKRGK